MISEINFNQYCYPVLPGMIDWLTLRLDGSKLDKRWRDHLLSQTGKIMKVDCDGVVEWESSARESIRSDSHQITVKFGSFLEIQGSPARVISKNNVFDSLNIRDCFHNMVLFVEKHYRIKLPRSILLWDVSKIDITRNYDMGSIDQCLQVIDSLKVVKVGRQKVKSEDTGCGWGYGSSLHMGKAYAKGPHMRMLTKKGQAYCSETELKKADRLLRLEYSVRRHFIRRIKNDSGISWYDFTPEFLINLHDQYFNKFISDIEVTDMDNILDRLLENVGSGVDQIKTEGRATAAYDCYTRIKLMGNHVARSTYARATWYDHMRNLRSVGIREADLQPMNVVPLKRRQIVLDQPVSCWDDIKLVNGM